MNTTTLAPDDEPPVSSSEPLSLRATSAHSLQLARLLQPAVVVVNPLRPELDVIGGIDRLSGLPLDIIDEHVGAVQVRLHLLVGARRLEAGEREVAAILRIIRPVLQHVGDHDQRFRDLLDGPPGEALDRDLLDGLHDRRRLARRGVKSLLQRYIERLPESVQPALPRDPRIGSVFAEPLTVAWIAPGEDRFAARRLRVEQPDL